MHTHLARVRRAVMRRGHRRRQLRRHPFVVERLLALAAVLYIRAGSDARACGRVIGVDGGRRSATIALPVSIVRATVREIDTLVEAGSIAVGVDRRLVVGLTTVGSTVDMEWVVDCSLQLLKPTRGLLGGFRSLRVARVGKLSNHTVVGGGERPSGIEATRARSRARQHEWWWRWRGSDHVLLVHDMAVRCNWGWGRICARIVEFFGLTRWRRWDTVGVPPRRIAPGTTIAAPMDLGPCSRARIVGLVVVRAEAARAVCSVTACRNAQLRLVVDPHFGLELD